jgi:hypothetical protein
MMFTILAIINGFSTSKLAVFVQTLRVVPRMRPVINISYQPNDSAIQGAVEQNPVTTRRCI